MSLPPASLPFDTRPLTEPVNRSTSRAYVRQLRVEGRMPQSSSARIILAVVIGGFFLLLFGSAFAGIIGAFVSIGGSAGFSPLFALFPVVILIAIVATVATVIWKFASGRYGSARTYRLDRFAQANGMTWHPEASAPPLPGMIFDIGHARQATDIIRGTKPRLVEFANYTYKTGSGKEETTHRWGYVAVKLATPLPHIVLDAVGNNSFLGSNLPASFNRDQRLSLEGDFDEHFQLYCPEGYERDALYLFTPDIMARFIDNAAALDVEIVDDWLFLYTQREVSTLDPATWAWLFSVVAALLGKLDQWERWRDDRLASGSGGSDGLDASAGALAPAVAGSVSGGGSGGAAGASAALPFVAPSAALRPPAGVAAPGRRLKRGVPWVFIVFAAVFLAVWLIAQFGFFRLFASFGGVFGG